MPPSLGESADASRDETLFPQSPDRPARQISVLEAPAREHDFPFIDGLGHLNDHFRECMMEAGRDRPDRDVVLIIPQQRMDHRLPVRHLKGIDALGFVSGGGELKFHGGLAFKRDDLPKVEERRDRIKQAAALEVIGVWMPLISIGCRSVSSSGVKASRDAQVLPSKTHSPNISNKSPRALRRGSRIGLFIAGEPEGAKMSGPFKTLVGHMQNSPPHTV